jgi:hypothetical protein
LLPAEPPDENGNVPDRRRWGGVVVHVSHTNHSSDDPTWNLRYQATADADGRFEIALNPGDYIISPYDPHLLKDMMISPECVKVEAGRFTEVVIDYDKLNMTKVRLKQP